MAVWDFPGLLAAGAVFSFVMCFAMGCNDESMGSAYGSRAYTLRTAIIVGAAMEVLGSVLLGSEVSVTIQGKLFSLAVFGDNAGLVMYIFVCAVAGASAFLIAASYWGLPVSTTHGIVGAVTGVAAVAAGWDVIKGGELGIIVASWFTSPVVGGLMTALLLFIMEKLIIKHENSFEKAVLFAPYIYACTLVSLLCFILFKGIKMPVDTPWYVYFLPIVCLFFGTILIVKFLAMKWVLKWIEKGRLDMIAEKEKASEMDDLSAEKRKSAILNDSQGDEKSEVATEVVVDGKKLEEGKKEVMWHEIDPNNPQALQKWKADKVFVFLQMLTSAMVSFARGTNDVSHGVGPFAAVYNLYNQGGGALHKSEPVPFWILIIGGVGIAIGLFTLGRNVIKSVGDNITSLSPSKGICIELATALTVLICSAIGMPVSSTHTLVGAVFAVALYKEAKQWWKRKKNPDAFPDGLVKNVQWRNIIKMFASWIITIPAAAAVSIAIFFIFRGLCGETSV